MNTILTAKNTWEEGLIMDFSPDNTLSNCLTSALNATLITFNGNEMSLLGDFGNGRVETAYLPEGYVPVGTCEFGDIIYIVSYNPLINKSLIGCFPSPERNISSDEVSDLLVSILSSELVENGKIKNMSVKKILFDKELHAGDKYMVYTLDNLEDNSTTLSDYGNTSHIHGYWPKLTKIHIVSIEESGKITMLDSDVKWYKDKDKNNDYYINKSTKTINNSQDLDSYRNLVSSAWSIFQSKVSGKLALLIELESITGFSCTHTVKAIKSKNDDNEETTYEIYFNSSWTTNHNDVNPSGIILTKAGWQKRTVSGEDQAGIILYGKDNNKKINLPDALFKSNNYSRDSVIPFTHLYDLSNPSSTYESYIESDSYNAKINDTIKNLIPSVPVYNITLSKELGKYYCNLSSIEEDKYYYIDGNGVKLSQEPKEISDDVVNNYFFKDVRKHIGNLGPITTSTTETEEDKKTIYKSDLSNLIWEYTVAPVMPYGVLELFAISNSIDFSKVGNKSIELTDWRYYNSGDLSILVIGLDAYTLENYGISEICLEFFDNNGMAAAYHISDKSSYSGEFTNYIQLNSKNRNYLLNDINSEGKSFKHPGALYVDDGKENNDVTDDGKYYNDAGTLYPNWLYLVRIVVKYAQVNELGQFSNDKSEWEYFYRWYWTTTMFNDLYFSNVKDFVVLLPELYLNSSIQFTDIGISKSVDTYHYTRTDDNTLGAVITHINLEYNEETKKLIKKPNIRAHVNIGLEDDYGVFNLNKDGGNFKGKLYLGESSITTDYDGAEDIKPIIMKEEELLKPGIGYVPENTLGTEFYKSIGLEEIFKGNPDNEIYSTEESYKEYKDTFGIEFNIINPDGTEKDSDGTEKVSYKNINGEVKEGNYKYININYDENVSLVLSGIRYNKFKYSKKEKHSYEKYTSILNKYGLDLLSLGYDSPHMFFTTASFLGLGDKHGHRMHAYFSSGSTSLNTVPLNLETTNRMNPGDDSRSFDILAYKEIPDKTTYLPIVATPLYLVGYDDDGGLDWTFRVESTHNISKLLTALWGSSSTNTKDFYGGKRPSSVGSGNKVTQHEKGIHTLAFRYDSVIYAINDIFITDKYGRSQTFVGSDTNSKNLTMADFIANLYGNLYLYDIEELKETGVDLLLDLSNEIWNKEIITKLEISENYNNNLLFYEYPYSDYITLVETKLNDSIYNDKYKDNIKNNISFNILAETKCTNLNLNLEGCKVEEQLIDNSIIMETKDGDIFVDKVGKGPYFLLLNDTLTLLSNSSFIYKISSWKKTETGKYFPIPNETVKFKVPLLVSKLIKCEDSRVYFDGRVLVEGATSETINWIAEEDEDKILVSPFYNFSLLNNLTWNG